MAAAISRLSWMLWAVCLLLGPVMAAPPKSSDFSAAKMSSGDALSQLNQQAKANADAMISSVSRRAGSGCTASQLKIRREWRTLSSTERKSFISAVKCLQGKPSLFDPVAFPGSKSLFDDFVTVHLLQTGNIHLTATFLTWHRYYIWVYEQRLKNECGYTGVLPYWEWGLDVNNPSASPVFDGSDTSLGGNGQFFSHPGLILGVPFSTATIPLPPGNGGGCVTTGPFANMTVHLGPVVLPQYGSNTVIGVANPLADNPRCLKRDLNSGVAKRWNTFLNSTSLILNNNNIEMFQAVMQADPRYPSSAGELGVHGGGHYIIGGDPGSDPFISPGDPAFYLHHAQIDRLYWIWQLLDFPNRQNVWGTGTILDVPPSPNVTVNDFIDISPLAAPVQIKDLMNTVGGAPFCYVYL